MLYYSIRAPLAPSISPGLYGWVGRGGTVSHGTRAEVLGTTLDSPPNLSNNKTQVIWKGVEGFLCYGPIIYTIFPRKYRDLNSDSE
jgi:hypothetical protein